MCKNDKEWYAYESEQKAILLRAYNLKARRVRIDSAKARSHVAVREAPREKGEKLSSFYAGNPRRATARPSTEMMLKAFEGISLVVSEVGDTLWQVLSTLNAM